MSVHSSVVPRRIIHLVRAELPESKPVLVLHPPGHLVVVRQGEQVYALDHACCHGDASLLSAQIGEGTLTCRAHGYCFALKTGELLHPHEPLRQRCWRVERRDEGWDVLDETL